jgi:hypothetical protein
VSLIAALGQLNVLTGVLYHQFNKTEIKKQREKIHCLVEVFQYYNTYGKSSVGLAMFCASGNSVIGFCDSSGTGRFGCEPQCGEILRTRQERPRGPPILLQNGYRLFFPGGRAGGGGCEGVAVTIHLV